MTAGLSQATNSHRYGGLVAVQAAARPSSRRRAAISNAMPRRSIRSRSTSSFYRPAQARRPMRAGRPACRRAFRFAVEAAQGDHARAAAGGLRESARAICRERLRSLGEKRGPILIQLPPKLGFDTRVATRFFGLARDLLGGSMCEPRHAGWFVLGSRRATRGASGGLALPPTRRRYRLPQKPGWVGWLCATRGCTGRRASIGPDYDLAAIELQAGTARAADVETWTIYDNTAAGRRAA